MAYAVRVFLTVVLRRKDPCPGDSAENTEIIDKQYLVDDGNAGHGLGPDLADHDVVQHIHKVCDTVLDHDGDGNGEYHLVEIRITKVFFPESSHKNVLLICKNCEKIPRCLRRGIWLSEQYIKFIGESQDLRYSNCRSFHIQVIFQCNLIDRRGGTPHSRHAEGGCDLSNGYTIFYRISHG